MLFDRMTIVGVGMLGGSLALAARTQQVVESITGVDTDDPTLALARSLAILDQTTTDLSRGVADADLVVFCTPVDRIASLALQASKYCRPGTLLTDVGSTKANIVATIEQEGLPAGVEFVGGHPLAGSEKSGPEDARADLFEGRAVVLTPREMTAHTERLARFWATLGSSVHYLDPVEHDRILARTSHLPHLVASALAGLLTFETMPFAATGFRDTTRLASGDPELWRAIFEANREALLASIAEYRDVLDAFARALDTEEGQDLVRLLEKGKTARDELAGDSRPKSKE